MAKISLKLDELIDGEALRREMTALTTATDGDGSGKAARAGALQLLKTRLAEGRKIAEAMLMEDGGGNACAERLSHLMASRIAA